MKTKKTFKKKIAKSCLNAKKVLNYYAELTAFSGSEDELVIDLLTDLRHYCKKSELHFAHLSANAMMHAKAEEEGQV